MDPNTTLKEIRRAAYELLNNKSVANADGLLAAWDDLDQWLSNGGFTPDDWTSNISLDDWKTDVNNGDTVLGFREWWAHQVEYKIANL